MIFQLGLPVGGGALSEIIRSWQEIGVFDVILPFLLVFTMAFAVLEKSSIFGQGKKNVNLIVSLILGLFFLQNNYLVFVVQRFLPNVSMALIAFLMFLLLFAIFAGTNAAWRDNALILGFIVSVVAVVISLSTDIIPFGEWGILDFYYGLDPATRGLIWLVILIAVVIGFVSREGRGGGEAKGVGKWLGDLVKGMSGGGGHG